jgi:hypothetical protein
VIEQVPAAISVTMFPDTVQTDGVVETKVTAEPELAVAAMENGGTDNVTLASVPNVIVWRYFTVWATMPEMLGASFASPP